MTNNISCTICFQAQELTGVAVPKYYNPAAVNPLKYAEQVQKRKLLWSKSNVKKEVNSHNYLEVICLGFVLIYI